MNILITAGGTTEKIDDVRKITNSGTGRLGASTADCFASYDEVKKIYFVCSEKAVRPATDKATVIVADDTNALEIAVRNLCADGDIDVVVHSMAVSDYKVKSVYTGEFADDKIVNLASAESGGKISSDNDNLIILMEKTPKIIALFREYLPDALLFGFKLLVDASEEKLIDVAYNLLIKNDCDYVVSNDLRTTGQDNHIAHIVDREKKYSTIIGKDKIAAAICDISMNRFATSQ